MPTLNLPQPAQTKPQPVPINRQNGNGGQNDSRWMRYGSIVGTPPSPMRSGGASLRLPGPAMDPDAQGTGTIRRNEHGDVSNSLPRLRPSRRSAPAINPADGSAFEAGKTRRPFRHVSFTGTPRRSKSATNASTPHERPLLRRIFSPKPASHTAAQSDDDMPLEALKAIDIKQAEFFDFLDQELNKIETFYDSKEEEATKRLDTLRAQLHIMRDHRLEEIVQAQRRKEARAYKGNDALEGVDEFNHSSGHIMANPEHVKDLPNALDMLYHPIKAAKQIQFRPHPHHNNNLATPPSSAIDHNKDYTRRPEKPEVPYLTAKRKLKAALQEYYRGLELLKAYALLNRTAFRKINKKYDKAVHARPTMRYMYERVNNAHFVKSSILDGHITAVEDLYARYFEKGNHKIAVNKLRKKNSRIGHYTGSVFRNGVFAAAGLVFGIEGLVYGAELLFDSDPLVTVYTSYLLQVRVRMRKIHIRQLLILVLVVRGILSPTLPLLALLLRLRSIRACSRQFSVLLRIRSTDYFELATNGRATLFISIPSGYHTMAQLLANWWRDDVYLLASNINGADNTYHFCTCTNILPSFAKMVSLQLGTSKEATIK